MKLIVSLRRREIQCGVIFIVTFQVSDAEFMKGSGDLAFLKSRNTLSRGMRGEIFVLL